MDAAILFSDILVPVEPMGINFAFNPAPVLDPPVRSAADVNALRTPDPEADLPYVFTAIQMLRQQLEGKVPLIGFGPAPFTLSAYLVEGKGSKDFEHTKAMLYAEPRTAHRLLEKVTVSLERYLEAQVFAGAQAIKVFDTWAGMLSRNEFREFALPYVKRLIEAVRRDGIPKIYFALNSCHLLEEIRVPESNAIRFCFMRLAQGHGE